MVKRVLLVAIVVAAFFVVATPALAFNGYRADYTTCNGCAMCQRPTTRRPAGLQRVGRPRTHDSRPSVKPPAASPYGSVCAGCHTANYDPSKVMPDSDSHPDGTAGRPSRGASPTAPDSAAGPGDAVLRVGTSAARRATTARRRAARPTRTTAHAPEQPGQSRDLRPVPLALLLHRQHV